MEQQYTEYNPNSRNSLKRTYIPYSIPGMSKYPKKLQTRLLPMSYVKDKMLQHDLYRATQVGGRVGDILKNNAYRDYM